MRVLVGGCFNKIHFGHVYFLSEAKALGNSLSVVLTHDKNNRKRNKVLAANRVRNLAKLKIADEILVGDAHDFMKPIKKSRPDLVFLGYDQALPTEVSAYLSDHGIKIRRLGKFPGYQKTRNKITGRVVSGMAQAARFMELPAYQQKISIATGHSFFPGTFNIQTSIVGLDKYLRKDKMITVNAFNSDGRQYGGIKLMPARLLIYKFHRGVIELPITSNMSQEKVWILIPERTRHSKDVAEIVHEKHLRSLYNLKDDDLIELVV